MQLALMLCVLFLNKARYAAAMRPSPQVGMRPSPQVGRRRAISREAAWQVYEERQRLTDSRRFIILQCTLRHTVLVACTTPCNSIQTILRLSWPNNFWMTLVLFGYFSSPAWSCVVLLVFICLELVVRSIGFGGGRRSLLGSRMYCHLVHCVFPRMNNFDPCVLHPFQNFRAR
ncbi:hypothetical protein C8R45DRAFT_186678 [Mycena sanguinolenta]|nr:hypothetical protein C8R45DRAFT_186678 [Mycena sanguinolenta]